LQPAFFFNFKDFLLLLAWGAYFRFATIGAGFRVRTRINFNNIFVCIVGADSISARIFLFQKSSLIKYSFLLYFFKKAPKIGGTCEGSPTPPCRILRRWRGAMRAIPFGSVCKFLPCCPALFVARLFVALQATTIHKKTTKRPTAAK